MVRTYKRIREKKYHQDDIDRAKTMVSEGTSKKKAAELCNIPRTTLNDILNRPTIKRDVGHPKFFTAEQEVYIAKALNVLAQSGHPQNRGDLATMVTEFVTGPPAIENPFTNNRPGDGWVIAFERRNQKYLARRKPEVLTIARAKSLTTEVVDAFFIMWENVLKENNLEKRPEAVFNCDETGKNTALK